MLGTEKILNYNIGIESHILHKLLWKCISITDFKKLIYVKNSIYYCLFDIVIKNPS